MITEQLKNILLSKRILQEDSVGAFWIDEYFYETISGLEIEDTEILVCNSLQRRCACATIRNKKVIILDNYLSEIFIVFNQILCNEDDSKYLVPLFYKLAYEAYFLNGNIKLAAVYKTLMINKFRETGNMQVKQVSRDSNPRYLYAQQTFLVMHEAIHSFFKDSPDAYIAQKEAVATILDKMFYSKKMGHVQMVSDEYLEELCCDHLAAISAIAISVEHGHCSEMDAACAIIMALHYQFLLLCIDRMVEDNYLSDNVGEFAIRVTISRLFVSNYFKVVKPDLVDSINSHITNNIKIWEKRYLESLTAFLSSQKLNELKYNEILFSSEEMEKLQEDLRKGFSNLD